MDATTDPALRSFLPVAPESHFPIKNLPYGIFSRTVDGPRHLGVAIGDRILDLRVLAERGLLPAACLSPRLNPLLQAGQATWREVRATVRPLERIHDLRVHPPSNMARGESHGETAPRCR